MKCSGAECCDGVVYTTEGFGFLCMPRNITERLAEQGRVFDESDAWLDLWCHTVFRDYGNAFSFLDGDLWRLFRFREAILDRAGSFRVVCFQKQIPFLKSYLGDKVTLSTVKMETVERVFRIEGKCLL